MLTPSSVAAELMARAGVRRALVLGSPGVGQALRDARIDTVQADERGEREVQAVYVGWHPECTMKDIEAACQAIWAGARLYVASDVPFFATKQGRTMGYSLCHRRRHSPHDPGADDSDRQAVAARAAIRGESTGAAALATSGSSATTRRSKSSWRDAAAPRPSP